MKVIRTVKDDLTVRVDGIDLEPLDQHGERLMRRWIGMRVKVEDKDFWATKYRCALRLPAMDVMQVATLHVPQGDSNGR